MTASCRINPVVTCTLEMSHEESGRLKNILEMASEHLLLDIEDHNIICSITLALNAPKRQG